MREVAHPSMNKAVSDVLLKNDGLIAPTATFVSNYVSKGSSHVKKEEQLVGSG